MAIATKTSATGTTRSTTDGAGSPGFRPSSRSRIRIVLGLLLAVAAVAVSLLVFATADKRVAVLQAVHDIPAGQQVVADDFRSIELSSDPSLAVVRASDVATIVGSYARVRIASGTLLAPQHLQPVALVAPGSAVVAVTIKAGEKPAGLRERSQVKVVFPHGTAQAVPPAPVAGRVVGLPTTPDSVTGELSVSIEVASADAVTIAQATSVHIVLLDPGVDPASPAVP